ncbi:hypothetical protein D030_1914A, partial [Vibrio parahaemolyticus AQ3810]
MVRSLSLT